MQPNLQSQDLILARFMHLSRLHLDLMQAPAAVCSPRPLAKPSRHILRSLIVAGSLGALFGGPAFAAEANRPADPAKRNQNTQNSPANVDDGQDLSTKPPLAGKYR